MSIPLLAQLEQLLQDVQRLHLALVKADAPGISKALSALTELLPHLERAEPSAVSPQEIEQAHELARRIRLVQQANQAFSHSALTLVQKSLESLTLTRGGERPGRNAAGLNVSA